PNRLRVATSLAGVRLGGTLLDRPTTPIWAIRSMFGLRAAWRGVRPPRDSCGSSAQPSGMTMAYFTKVSFCNRYDPASVKRKPEESSRHGIKHARRGDRTHAVDLGDGSPEIAGKRGVRHDDQHHAGPLQFVGSFMLDDRRDANIVVGQDPGNLGQHARPVL